MKPTEQDWETMVFCQRIAHAVRRSEFRGGNLRLPRDPEDALKRMTELLESAERKDGAA